MALVIFNVCLYNIYAMNSIKLVFLFTCLVVFCACGSVKNVNEIVLATWNIGYFSNGVSGRSAIKANELEKKLAEYRTFIYDSIHADVISVNEYNRVFSGKDDEKNSSVTSSILFDRYNGQVVGPSDGIRKALFSNNRIKNSNFVYLKSHQNVVKDESIVNRKGYYIASDLIIGGKTVKLVCVHLLFSNKVPRVVQRNPMEELIEQYKMYDRVVMCGDWNTSDYSKFKEAGYTMANDGSLVTFPSKKTPLDNIIAKGVKISDVKVIETDLSDHFPIVCKISLIDE